MLDLLPSHLGLCVIKEWLCEWPSLLALDAAYCSRLRRVSLVALLRDEGYTHASYRKVLDKLVWKISIPKIEAYWGFLRWVVTRAAGLQELCLLGRHLPLLWQSQPALVLRNVKKISIVFFDDESQELPDGCLRCILAGFAGLEVLDLSRWSGVPDSVLLELQHLTTPLKSLNLDHCVKISSGAATQVAMTLGSSLQELRCNVLDAAALQQIAVCCPALTCLALTCDKLPSHSIASFCAAYPRLEELTLRWSVVEKASSVNDVLLSQIAAQCPGLRLVNVQQYTSVTHNCLPVLLERCPRLVELRCPTFECRVRTANRGCLISVTRRRSYRTAHDIAANCPIPIVSLLGPLNAATASLLADRHGPSIEALDCDLGADVASPILQRLLSRCKKLTSLSLHPCRNACDDEVLRRLPEWCPALTTLSLEDTT